MTNQEQPSTFSPHTTPNTRARDLRQHVVRHSDPTADPVQSASAIFSNDPSYGAPFLNEPFGIPPDYIHEILERKNVDKFNKIGGLRSLFYLLQSDPETGIKSDTIDRRVEIYGPNVIDKKNPARFIDFLIEAFKDKIILILSGCAIVSIVLGLTLPNPYSGEVEHETGWIEGVAILISVLIVTFTGAINNYRKAKKFEEMERVQAVTPLEVLRDGQQVTVMSDKIVVGDVLDIEGGMQLSVDGVMINGADLKCDESAMTGEADLIHKDLEHDPFFLSGTQIDEGRGRMMVVAVGMQSFAGRLKQTTDGEAPETPLQAKLGTLADWIGKIGAAVAIILFASLCIKETILITTQDKKARAITFVNFFIIAIAIVVVAIPEGLPLAVTISLAYSMKSMMSDNCLARVLASCETMGAATAICSDKTGTLTQNQMTMVQGVVCREEFVLAGYGLIPRHFADPTILERDNAAFRRLKPNAARLFAEAIALNSTARQQMIDGVKTWVGNKTEQGLLGFCNFVRFDFQAARDRHTEQTLRQFQFNSTKKRMTTIVRKGDACVAYVKGASEIILGQCQEYMNENGERFPLTAEQFKIFDAEIEDMAAQGNRTVGIALADVKYDQFPEDEPEDLPLVFLGVLGIQDPIREEVPEAVQRCTRAGVTVRMLTGDNIHTAIAIAKKSHIYEDNNWDLAMLGEDFRRMSETESEKQELYNLVPRLRVLARTSPQDKFLLVKLLQEMDEIVGVTGDGTNDAPALSLANVGFAMQSGTDIAKGSADMVLLDDNFASVVNAVRWGRGVNDNVRKFIQYQLSINFAGVLITFVGALASESSKEPFSTVQLLWLNLIMDTLAALALATEKPGNECLQRLPVFKDSSIITRRMMCFIGIHGAFQTLVILIILFTGHDWLKTVEGDCDKVLVKGSTEYTACSKKCTDEGGVFHDRYCQQGRVHSTIMFNIFIWFQIFNMLNARKLYSEFNIFTGFRRAIPMVVIFFIVILVQVLAVEVGGRALDTIGLAWNHWLICIAFGASELLLGALVRLLGFEDPIPRKVQDEWDRVDKLREARGLPPIDHHHLDDKRVLVKHGDPALKRTSSVVGRHGDTHSLSNSVREHPESHHAE